MSAPSFDEHAAQARQRARAHGLADCIHYAPRWQSRADALYAEANASGLPWWRGPGTIGLLADGRMVLTSELAWFVELSTS